VRGRPYLASLAGRRVAVVGLARSGIAAARLLREAGAQVVGTDVRPIDALSDDARALQRLGVRLIAADADPLAGAELVVVSPGIPLDGEQLAPARRRGVPVIGELELGWRASEGQAVAITGTNGKTTTTALIGALLARQGWPVLVAGNIGTPLAGEALRTGAPGWLVLEVSSFQLETIETFRPRVAAVLNVTPDHLDRHGTLAAYTAAKARIFENQGPGDVAVLNADDPGACALAASARVDLVWFSRRRELPRGVFVRDGSIVACLEGTPEPIGPLGEIPLRGAHNVENVLAAAACARWLGASPALIREGIGAFRAVAHRIEFVRALDGVSYYNDSKGTNVESTIKALESFPEPVVLIAGGKGKGQDFAPLARAARGRVTLAVLIGEDAGRLAAAFAAEGLPTARNQSLSGAVHAARAGARAGHVVLLSPACASFDMFDSYEHRGDTFKQLVEDLRPEAEGRSGWPAVHPPRDPEAVSGSGIQATHPPRDPEAMWGSGIQATPAPGDSNAVGGSGAPVEPKDSGGLGPASPEASDTGGAALAPPQHQ
jgi:UDP-N-acetylmuramoylalanine--D-glutamate ligase